MLPKSFHLSKHVFTTLMIVVACAMLSACAATASSNPPPTAAPAALSAQSPAQLIAQLQQAKAIDQSELRDSTISLNRRGDLLEHEAATNQALVHLQHGFPVDPARLTYALEVPPSHLSAAQRTALTQQLKDAIEKDEAREQAVVAFSTNVFYEDPDAPSEFGGQEMLAQEELRKLQEGEHVSWDELQQALYVPPDRL